MNLNFNPNPEQTLAMTACMLAVAHVDGVHPSETALIEAFYNSGRDDSMPLFDELGGVHAQAQSLLLPLRADAQFAESLVSMCLVTGYADGSLSDGEHEAVLAFAGSLDMTAEQVAGLRQSVGDSLLGSLAHLPNAASVAALATEL